MTIFYAGSCLPTPPRWTRTGLLLMMLALLMSLPVLSLITHRPVVPDLSSASASAMPRLPLSFIPNAGQADPAVHFQARGLDGTIFFANNEVVLALPTAEQPDAAAHEMVVRLRYANANPTPAVRGAAQLPGVAHYFLGNDQTEWHTSLPTYGDILYEQIYPGVDLRFEGTDGNLKSTYVVAPGIDPAQIRWHYDGAMGQRIDASGDLVITLPGAASAPLVERAPIAWQDIAGERIPVAVEFTLTGNQVGFALGAYDASYPLVIDPTLEYSTFLGGDNFDAINDIVVDATGNAYVTGETTSSTFPGNTPDTTYGTSLARPDVFVTKINPDGTQILFSAIIGGGNADKGLAIALDGNSVYVAGETSSSTFPTNGTQTAFDPNFNGSTDGFALALDATTGETLEYSTFLGGAETDIAYGIAASGASIYVTGAAEPSSFAEPPTSAGGRDAFVVRLNRTNGTADYATRLGGLANDEGRDIAVDSSGDAYIVGTTSSTDATFTTMGTALQGTKAIGSDAFIARFDPSGTLLYSSYLGGNGNDVGLGIVVPPAGDTAYVTGYTLSSDFPSATGYSGTQDAFVVSYDLATPAIIFSDYLGGVSTDRGNSIALDGDGNVYVTGSTNSNDFPTVNPIAGGTYQGGQDAFATRLDPAGNIIYSTFLGGTGQDAGNGIDAVTLASGTKVYVAGSTISGDFPIVDDPAPLQETKASGSDGFVTKIQNVRPLVDLNGTDTGIDFAATFNEDGGPVAIVNSTGLTVSDTDNADLSFAEIILTNPLDGAAEELIATASGAVTIVPYASGTGILRLNGPAPLADFQAVLQTVQYNNTSGIVNTTDRVVTFEVNDGLDGNDPLAEATITVNAVNDPPTFTPGSDVTVAEDSGAYGPTAWATAVSPGPADEAAQTVTFQVTNDNNPLFAVQPALDASGNLTFTPTANIAGSATVTVQAQDDGGTANGGQDTSAPQTFTITVTPANDPPVANDDTASTDEDTPVEIEVLTNDNDDADTNFGGAAFLPPSSLTVTSGPSNGSVVENTSTISYTPALDYSGSDSFAYEVCDNGTPTPAECATATVTITVNAVNDPPTFTPGSDVTVAEDSGAYGPTAWATAISPGPADEAGQTVSFVVSADNTGLFSTQPALDGSGALTFTPVANAAGSTTVTVQAQDDGGTANGGQDTSAPQTFTITVTPANDPPVVQDDTVEVAEDTTVEIEVLTNDNDDADTNFGGAAFLPPSSLTVTSGPSNGSAVENTSTISYTPTLDYSGSDSFTYEVCDNGTPAPAECATATVTITVTPANDPPTFTPGSDVTIPEDSGAYGPTAWATAISPGPADEAGQTVSFLVTADNTGLFSAQPALDASGALTFTPVANAAGSTTVTVQAQDDGGTANGGQDTSAPQTFTITVTPANDPPVANDDTASTDEDTPVEIEVLTNDNDDADTNFGGAAFLPPSSLTVTSGPSNGSVVENTSTISYTPAAEYSGSDSFTYEVCDNGTPVPAECVSATVTITVNAVNDPPVAEDDPGFTTPEDTALAIATADLLSNDSDVEDDPLTISAVSMTSVQSGTVVLSGTEAIYTPAPDFNGTDTFTYTVEDGADGMADATVTVEVTPVNDPPNAQNDLFTIIIGSGSETLDVLTNDSDVEGDTFAITEVTTATLGTTSITGDRQEITYTPTTEEEAEDSFTYTVCDTGNPQECATATVRVKLSDGRVFLPLMVGEIVDEPPPPPPPPATAPDLVIERFTITPNDPDAGEDVTVEIVVTNEGDAPTDRAFWVDFYINPELPTGQAAPTVNDRWDELCADGAGPDDPCYYGIAWEVDQVLAPGATLTLTSASIDENNRFSRWAGYFVNGTTDLYAQVDSWNPEETSGALVESDETNNTQAITGLSVSGENPPLLVDLPERLAPRP